MQGEAALLWRDWDGLCVLYHTGSGDTHVLDLMGGLALRALERGPALADDVITQVAATLGRPGDEDLARHVETLLEELAALSLIEPALPNTDAGHR